MLDFKALEPLLARHKAALAQPVRGFEIGGRPFDFNRRRALVGVINLSSDSWYRESVCTDEAAAVERGRLLAQQGADLVDIGAESTLPDAARVSPAEQEARLVPVVRALSREGILVSAESYHPQVLEAAAEAGARIFNLTGGAQREAALKLARRFEAAVIHCYVQGPTVREAADFTLFDDMMGAVEAELAACLAAAERHGVTRNIVDPGLGFYYRNLEDGNLRVAWQLHAFANTFRLHRLGWPTMNILPHAPEIFGEAHRRAAEPFFAVLALLGGTHVIRTHELDAVARIRQALAQYDPARFG